MGMGGFGMPGFMFGQQLPPGFPPHAQPPPGPEMHQVSNTFTLTYYI